MHVVNFNEQARRKLKKGVDLIADAVKVTLGPRGKNVIYGYHYGYPVVTKDGVTVARQVESKDQTEQLGTLLVRQVAQKTADDAGDGTTTACVLAQAIYTEGLKGLGYGANPVLIKRGIDKAVEMAVAELERNKKEIGEDEVIDVATLSANNDKVVGEIVTEAIKKVGDDGIITIEDNYNTATTHIDMVEGMQLNEGMISPYFITDREKQECFYRKPLILLVDAEVNMITQITKAVEIAVGQEKRPLVIIANNVTGEAITTLCLNRAKQGLPLVACKASQFGDYRSDMLDDIAVLIGGKVVGNRSGLEADQIELSDFGECETFRSTKHYTTIIGGKGEKEDVDERIKTIQFEISVAESDYEKEKLQERLAKLTSGVAVIKVGASTEVELKEKKMRFDDALHATRAAMDEGIVAGGGLALLNVSKWLKDKENTNSLILTEEEWIGYHIVTQALREPIQQIARNAGADGSEIIAGIDAEVRSLGAEEVYGPYVGYNFLTNEYCNLIAAGVVDPLKVVRAALENAASVAGMLLTTDCVINEEAEDEVTKTPKARSE